MSNGRFNLTIAAVTFIAALAVSGSAYAAPVKLVLSAHFGREVNLTEVNAKAGDELEDICAVESGDECQAGKESSIAGGFAYPYGVAGAPNGDIYVADRTNHRIEELTAEGLFVMMFGKHVNATTSGDVCTAASNDVCQGGIEGSAPGQLYAPYSVAVDPANGDVYIAEIIEPGTPRVQKFTAEGEFILEIGKEVNETTKGNLCTEEEVLKASVKCGGPAEASPGTTEQGAFHFGPDHGDLLAVGSGSGSEHNPLYVGDEHRVQEFEPDGQWKGEISLAGISSEPRSDVGAIAVNDNTGIVFLTYGLAASEISLVRQYESDGKELTSFEIAPRESGGLLNIDGLAVDAEGHLAVTAIELEKGQFGSLYESSTARKITDFAINAPSVGGIGFGAKNGLYVTATNTQEVLAYLPEKVAELRTGDYACGEGTERETSVTFDCTLKGEANPYDVSGTNAWFEWGAACSLGSETPSQALPTVESLLPVSEPIDGLRPKEAFCYRLAGDDQNVQLPERLEGEKSVGATPDAPPKIVGSPAASFVGSSSAVISGELNPENTATEYFFEYGPGESLMECPEGLRKESCPGVAGTATLTSALYGKVGATSEAPGLQPDTSYRFRLAAVSEAGVLSTGASESFTTTSVRRVEAATGGFGAVTSTSALISGTVDSGGEPATYAFEVGVNRGAATQYGIVSSGSTGTAPEVETVQLTGLQPGTEYAYRIAIDGGYGSAVGTTMVFKTEGLPAVLAIPAQLPMLSTPFGFPKPPPPACRKGYERDKQHKCVKARKKAKKKSRKKASKKKR